MNDTKIMSQIHDDILFDLYPPEQDEIISIVQNIMTQKIRIQFDWLIVPMSAEIKLSGIDESWYDLEKI